MVFSYISLMTIDVVYFFDLLSNICVYIYIYTYILGERERIVYLSSLPIFKLSCLLLSIYIYIYFLDTILYQIYHLEVFSFILCVIFSLS